MRKLIDLRATKRRVDAAKTVMRAAFGSAAAGLSKPTRGSAGEALLRQIVAHSAGDADDETGWASFGAVGRVMGRDRSTLEHADQLVKSLREGDEDVDAAIGELVTAARFVEAVRTAKARRDLKQRDGVVEALRAAGKALREGEAIDTRAPELPPEARAILGSVALQRLLDELEAPEVERGSAGSTVRLKLPLMAEETARQALTHVRAALAAAAFRVSFADLAPTRNTRGNRTGWAAIVRLKPVADRPKSAGLNAAAKVGA